MAANVKSPKPASTASQTIALLALMTQLAAGQLTVPAFWAAVATLFGVPAPTGTPKVGVMLQSASAVIPANLQTDLQAYVDAVTQLQTDQAALAATNAQLTPEQAAVAADQVTASTALATFTADLAAFQAMSP